MFIQCVFKLVDMIWAYLSVFILEAPIVPTENGCQQDLTDSSSYLLSPSYPERYPNDVECTYNIAHPTGSHVVLTWEFFQIGSDCEQDSIKVGQHCGMTSAINTLDVRSTIQKQTN